jgi:DNA topoisomerase III
VDFTGKEPLGKCPKCGGRVFENGMNYTCENAVGNARKCDFRVGSIILQQPIAPAQLARLLADGKTDLLDKFISKRNGRAFKAFLVLGKDGKVGFEFEKREPKGTAKGAKKEPKAKLDFTGQEALGKCPKCGGRVFESETDFICENSQADKKPCKFKTGKTILQRPIEREQAIKLLAAGKTDLLEQFISKAGRPFSAWLVVNEEGKVGFEFPEREPT